MDFSVQKREIFLLQELEHGIQVISYTSIVTSLPQENCQVLSGTLFVVGRIRCRWKTHKANASKPI